MVSLMSHGLKNFPEHCSLDEARKTLLGAFPPLTRVERRSAEDSLGFVLAEDVASIRNVPHDPASAVDGNAIQASLTAGASAATPVTLALGLPFSWVNTGMPIGCLPGADAVAMVEDTSIEGGQAGSLKIYRSLTQGENVRAVGVDVMRGQLLACRGDRVTPALASLLICAGVGTIPVRARPRTIFIPTGDEIVSRDRWLSGEKIEAGLVVDSNSAYARAVFSSWGFALDVGPILPDDPDAIARAVSGAALDYDLVLVSAGSAKGKRDHSAEIFERLGRMLFRYVRARPGRPAMAAEISGTPVICLPGFPMSCAVTLWSLAYPLLKSISGEDAGADPVSEAIGSREAMEARFMVQHSSPQGVAEWLRMKCADVGGNRLCWPLPAGASVLWALAESDGIALLPEEALECPKGTKVSIRVTRRLDLSRRLLFQGSDDPAVSLLVPLVKAAGMDFVIRAVGSMGGLAALGRGEAHLAAAHLLDASDGTYNTGYIERFAEGRSWRRMPIFRRWQGIMTAPGNPKGISDFKDLASGRAVFENRQPGAGTRVLLDYMLRQSGLSGADVPGYDRISITHMEAANKVASGVADATLGIKAAADALGLCFIPIAQEPYELVLSENFDEHPASPALLAAMESGEWRAAVSRMGGYELD
jgi:putative molybdopterin biosynthesis protein